MACLVPAQVPLPPSRYQKPNDVLYAELALWVWTVWSCLFGIYHTWQQIPEIEDMLNGDLQGMISIDPDSLLHMAIAGYATIAVVSAWIIIKIGQGRPWARTSLIWGLGFEIVIAVLPPYHAPVEYLADIPDLGLQAFALYYLYTVESRGWFGGGK